MLPSLGPPNPHGVPDLTADHLVIGSGIAGLWYAYRASRSGTVVVVTKKEDSESNTNYAQGGIAAAVDQDDSVRLHYEDTLRAGAGLCHEDVVRIVTESGPNLVRELAELGVEFTTYRDARGRPHFDLGQEGGHCRRRIVHARDFTGLALEHSLLQVVRSCPQVTILEQHLAVDLIKDRSGRCCGVTVMNCETRRIETLFARVILLATGGIGQAYRFTTNPSIATGDGIAMGFRAGATVANMEFVQFHPTALYGHRLGDRAFLISEAVRGEGAILRTRDGRAFMPDYHPDAELAPRDVVARAIAQEMRRRGEEHVLLDATHLDPDRVRSRFPTIYETCLGFGLDMTHEPLPVVPAAHYVCGGLLTNVWAETSLPGLFAAGECACSGLHGANRLASNSLLEALVFADRAARRATQYLPHSGPASGFAPSPPILVSPPSLLTALQDLMWQHAGIVRTDPGLTHACSELTKMAQQARPGVDLPSPAEIELRNLLLVARLVVECARRRRESRGLHYNEDHPETDPAFTRDTTIDQAELRPSA
ncbi:MAG: L-aspartate oxidase [candidate division WOR-3 bacterium]